jgi:type VI secretion system (T6SS) baseplate-like injector VgrG
MSISPRVSRASLAFGIVAIVLLVLVSTRQTRAQSFAPAFSLARGIVVDVRDPQAAGRVKVRLPWVPELDPVWARVALPLGGNQRLAFWTLPEIGEEVVVGFDQGDLRNPIVIGSFWNGARLPASPH